MKPAAREGRSLASIRPGQTLQFAFSEGKLQQLRYLRTRLESLHFTLGKDGYVAEEIIRKPEIRHNNVAGVITDCLVWTVSLENRVLPIGIEARADAGKIDRRTEE
jgi:hypothetical protein